MFLLTQDRDACFTALAKLKRSLVSVETGPIVIVRVGAHCLGWFQARPSDNFHAYSDGYIIGKLDPVETQSKSAIRHDRPLPPSVHPLTTAVCLELSGSGIRVRPMGTTNAFYSGSSVSDMQLLVADRIGQGPSAAGVALLATTGYLPGNLTLFAKINRIPLLHVYDVGTETVSRISVFRSQPPDDEAMIARLVSIVPKDPGLSLGLSGGYDSRFVLGLLLRAGVHPTLVHLGDSEDEIVRQVGTQLRLPLRIITDNPPSLTAREYTVMTDGQIYYRGGHYSRLRASLERGSLFFTGLFADSMVKNAFKASWKIPRIERDMHARLVDNALLSGMREREDGLVGLSTRSALRRFLMESLENDRADGPFSGGKEMAAWFYFVHRGVRWTVAHLADLSFFAQPLFLMADLEALSLAIRSSAWSNFNNDRVRHLNNRLLPKLRVPYVDGQGPIASRGLLGVAQKVKYEYLKKGVAFVKGKADDARSSRRELKMEATSLPAVADAFGQYFAVPLAELLVGRQYSYSVKRAAATVHWVLDYLGERPPRDSEESVA